MARPDAEMFPGVIEQFSQLAASPRYRQRDEKSLYRDFFEDIVPSAKEIQDPLLSIS